MFNVMVDIETTSTDVNAGILAIACVPFSPLKRGQLPLKGGETSLNREVPPFYERIAVNSLTGYHRSADTMNWWSTQPQKLRDEIFSGTKPLDQVMREFVNYLSRLGVKREMIVWAHGVTFDIPILENAIRKCGLEIPWNYYNIRDTRTVFAMNNIDLRTFREGETYHHPLGDCRTQIKAILSLLNKLSS